jgi:hypothetical protein
MHLHRAPPAAALALRGRRRAIDAERAGAFALESRHRPVLEIEIGHVPATGAARAKLLMPVRCDNVNNLQLCVVAVAPEAQKPRPEPGDRFTHEQASRGSHDALA